MSAQHLSGPYSISKFRENSGAAIILGPDPDPAAADGEVKRLGTVDLTIEVRRGQGWAVADEDDPQQMATANLWAASPDLLAAALDAADLFDGDPEFSEIHAKLIAAIAKARGQ